MNHTQSNHTGLTLEEIIARKQAIKAAIAEHQKCVHKAYQEVVEPFTNVRSVSKYIGNSLLDGFTMLESAIWGYRLISRIFRLFRRR